MPPSNPSPESPSPAPMPPVTPPRKRRWMLYGCRTVLGLLLAIVATVFITLWWIQRPIKPVVLSPQEKAVVDEKLRVAGKSSPARSEGTNAPLKPENPSSNSLPLPTRGGEGSELPLPGATPDRAYIPGAKTLTLTEREINGLLNANTDLGKSVRLEFAKDAINAYIAVPIPKDFPIGGGKTFRARSRFRVSLGNDGAPYAILEDVTVFGLSLPKAWLGGLKGENLLDDATRKPNGKPILRGIKSLRIEPGALVLEVED